MSEDNNKCKPTPEGVMPLLDMYKIALDTRNLEIKLFWQRCNYFMVLNTAIAIGFFMQDFDDIGEVFPYKSLILCVLGFVVCLVWFKVSLGSKFWQSHWEQILSDIESKMALEYDDKKEPLNYFHNDEDKTRKRVADNLKIDDVNKGTCYQRLVMKKPSVSRWMWYLSIFFMVVWVVSGVVITCIFFW